MEKLTPSIQDYLKALLELTKDGEPVHSADIAETIGVSRASVSRAMNVLRDAGYIIKEKYGTITLTPLGGQTAHTVKKRNELLTTFLEDVLGVTTGMARADACRMEHIISAETAGKLEKYLREVCEVQG
jgi:Mn-dependent DtxR family transcriptional regulator